ncbi:cobalt-precorrin-6A reductase [Ancylobacter terrae]|uniref:cobalt-precorrin-6A reductase n=1 Tax=Ancylobacter sp. sgz301288 TaxID=3342077 RepID=UPI00385B1FCD
MTTRILLLGGTTQARELAALLATRPQAAVTVSLAGRTRAPLDQPVPMRSGGFGGAAGLAAYIEEHAIDLVVDATHPYAAAISHNAAEAVADTGIDLVALHRPPWEAREDDLWVTAETVEDALEALGARPRRVLVTLGRNEVRALEAAPRHRYLVRSIDPIEPPLAVPDAGYIEARGPFEEAQERDLLVHHRIDAIIAKNSGGEASYGKIAAARALRIEVILIARPPHPAVDTVGTVEEALAWIEARYTLG